MNSPQSFTTKLINKIQLTSDTYSFYFAKPNNFDFVAGQYVKLTLAIPNPDERGSSHFFTIASSPTEKDLMITTRIIKSSFKKTLDSLPIGSTVQMRGPHGAFVLDQQNTRPKVYLAGGIGITPARSMLVYLRDKNLTMPFILMSSFSNREEIIFFDDLNSLSNEVRKIIYVITFEQGRIDEEKIKRNVPDILNSLFYMSGPTTFVEAMEKLVKDLGVSEENIKTENFPGY